MGFDPLRNELDGVCIHALGRDPGNDYLERPNRCPLEGAYREIVSAKIGPVLIEELDFEKSKAEETSPEVQDIPFSLANSLGK